MYSEERKQKIREMIESHGQVSVADLAHSLNVSEMTIRRDLMQLSEHGFVERTHGGAVATDYGFNNFEAPMADRINHFSDEKRKIASAIARMIGQKETVYLSSGSTTYWVARYLTDRSDLTVIVNSIINAKILAQCKDMQIIVVGGFLRRSELSLVGHLAETTLKDLHVDKVIMGIRGIDPEYGLTSENPQELMTDRTMLGISNNVIIVADHTKFGFIAASRTAPVTAARTIVTTTLAPAEIVERITRQGVRIVQV
jgi:DeoR family transcriptional regulator, aga operon transcriptional repressor